MIIEKKQDVKLTNLLLSLHFNIGSIGFKYWKYAIFYKTKDKTKYNTMEEVYNKIAKDCKTTRTRVERNMRTSSNTAKLKIQKEYNYNIPLTQKVILSLLLEKIN